jgi:hypothetical protein
MRQYGLTFSTTGRVVVVVLSNFRIRRYTPPKLSEADRAEIVLKGIL